MLQNSKHVVIGIPHKPKLREHPFFPNSDFVFNLIHVRFVFGARMGDSTLFAVNFRGECKLVSISGSSNSFQNLTNQVRNKWHDIGNFSMLASFGSFLNCCLESDDDLNNISLLFKDCSSSFVNVELHNISTINPTDHPHVSRVDFRHLAPCSTIEYHGEEEEFGPLSCIPCYDVSPVIQKKSLLSDSWADLMKNGVGSVFKGGVVEFRQSLIKYSTKIGFHFVFKRNTRDTIYVVCKESVNKCSWFIRAKLQLHDGSFVIHKANLDHKCIGKLLKDKAKRLNPRIMGELISLDVKKNSDLGGSDVLDLFSLHYGVDIPYHKAWRSVEVAKDNIYGSFDESYNELSWYCKAVEVSNPGSVVILESNKVTHQFERVFLAFKACIDGFRSCRPMLFIDGTFLKGRAQGTLLTATAKDGNNGLFPVAYALVSAENTSNWEWFIRNIRDYIRHEEPIIYISDRNTGILSAVNNLFEKPLHFFCLYHLLQNLKGKFSSGWTKENRAELGDLFKKCAYAPDDRLFKEALEKFTLLGGKLGEDWIASLPVERWTYAYSKEMKRYGEMTSNAAESFNNWILKSRHMPVMSMLDSIRQKISKWFVKRKKAADSWNTALVPKYQAEWDVLENVGQSWSVDECTGGEFLVKSRISTTVDLKDWTCSCYNWQQKGFPCCHAVAVITRKSGSVYTYVSNCFKAESYRMTYSGQLKPIPETMKYECSNPDSELKMLPPVLNRPAGRPKKSRIPSYGEFPKKKQKTAKT